MAKSEQQKEINRKYVQSIIRKQLVISPKKDPYLLKAIWLNEVEDPNFVFCDLVKRLLREHYNVSELKNGYTPEAFKSLFESTGLDADSFCERFGINKNSYKIRRTRHGRMRAYDWQVLVKKVDEYLSDID